MSYQVLARKWRPQFFEDVVGQEHITRTLQNAITTNRLAHAFLFSGPRGVGKTTTARILARALNCKEGPTPKPCGVCDSCRETAAGTSVDVIEIDGASNRGIEHIRELREAVRYAPTGGKHKVYVIDEVHMLTNEAFNALLKTLEEPPPHVIFIFATTEPQKIPATIHSRCQRYGFKRISLNVLTQKLGEIAMAEKIAVSEQGLMMIARAAEGSMRDSQSLLDQAVSYSGLTVADEDLRTILGTVSQEALERFAGRLLAADAAGLLTDVDELIEGGQDMRQFLSGVVEHIRNLLVAAIAKDPATIIELPAADVETIKQQAGTADPERLVMIFDSLSKTLDDMRWSPHQRFTLEAGLIKACSVTSLKPLGEVLEHVRELEARLGAGPVPPAAGPAGAGAAVREHPAQYTSPPAGRGRTSPARHEPASGDDGSWQKVLSALKARKPALHSFLSHSTVLEQSASEVLVGVPGSFQHSQAEKPESRGLIEQIAAEVLGRKVAVKFRAVEAPSVRPAPKAPRPAKPAEHEPIVQDALRIFGGEVVETREPEE